MATTFEVEGMRVDRILESEGPFLDALTLFPQLTRDVLESERAAMEAGGALVPAADTLILAIQSYAIRTPGRTILIDTCVGNDKDFPRRADWHQQKGTAYMSALAAAGLTVDDIDLVLCTHLHVDHVGWNTRLDNGRWVPTFPNARYVFGRTEYDHWTQDNKTTPSTVYTESVLPIVEAGRVDFVASDAEIDDRLRLLPTPGHTPGHHAAILGKGDGAAMFIGDAMHSPLQMARPELSPLFDLDPLQAAQTRRAILDRMCDTRMLCCTAHFPSPSTFRVGRAGGAFRCEPS